MYWSSNFSVLNTFVIDVNVCCSLVRHLRFVVSILNFFKICKTSGEIRLRVFMRISIAPSLVIKIVIGSRAGSLTPGNYLNASWLNLETFLVITSLGFL